MTKTPLKTKHLTVRRVKSKLLIANFRSPNEKSMYRAYSCPTGPARPDPAQARSGPARLGLARLARITNRAGPGRPTCRALCTSTARGPVWRAGPARYARRASWAVPARARLGICTRLPLSQLRMISRFQI